MYKNDKTLDINLEIKEIANLINKRNDENEDLKQNLSVNKKFKKEAVKEEIHSINETLKQKKKIMKDITTENHLIKFEIQEHLNSITNIKDKVSQYASDEMLIRFKKLDDTLVEKQMS